MIKPLEDRMIFEEERLPNGITVYNRPSDTEYTIVHLQVPVGTAHNAGSILPGSAHFLEHICYERSKRCPEWGEFARLVGLYGGHSNARTAGFRTTYELSVPNRHLDECLPALFSAAFEPQITDESIDSNRTVIASERKRKRWYPGGSEVGQYVNTRWMFDRPFPLEQVLGSDEDLAQMSAERLLATHDAYFSPEIKVVAVGNGDLAPLRTLLSELSVGPRKLPTAYELIRWEKREYHEQAFRDINRFELRFGNFKIGKPDARTRRQMRFIGSYLVNSVHGPLYRWLRQDRGWAYDLSFSLDTGRFDYDCILYVPLANREQVATVRQELWERICAALANREAVSREVDRILDGSCYWDPTPGSIIGEAQASLDTHGRIISSTEWREHIESCRDAGVLSALFEERFNETEVGSFCAVPE